MASLLRELKKIPTEAGCYLVRSGKGDHETWYSPINDSYFTVDAGARLSSFSQCCFNAGWPSKTILRNEHG